jgi:integrase
MAIYKRKDSKVYWMKFTFKGKLVQRSTKCTNKRDAEKVESAYRTQLAMGQVGIAPAVKAPTFQQVIDDFLKQVKIERAQKPASYRRYKGACVPLLAFFGGNTPVDRIEEKDIKKYQAHRLHPKSKSVKPVLSCTVNYELFRLKTIFRKLVRDKVLTNDPTQYVKSLPVAETAYHVITAQEEKPYLLACSQPLRDIAEVMLGSGMRPSEVFFIERKYVTIRNTPGQKDYLQITHGKTKSSNRRVFLSARASEILQGRLKRFKGENLFPFGEIDGNCPTGKMTPDERDKYSEKFEARLWEVHQRALKSIDARFRIYDCRHTFATRALESKINLRTLADLLGHASLDEVMRYAHVSDDMKNDAINDMDDAKKAA